MLLVCTNFTDRAFLYILGATVRAPGRILQTSLKVIDFAAKLQLKRHDSQLNFAFSILRFKMLVFPPEASIDFHYSKATIEN